MGIFLYNRNAIDTVKWDKCIANSFNGIIYGFSWYLDIVCDKWEALIEDDYIRVMPLTAGYKYYTYYLYQPFFTQQLGVFSVPKLDSAIINNFLDHIPSKYKMIEINLNTFLKFENSKFVYKKNVTYQLDLIKQYDNISALYSAYTKRNLNHARSNQLVFSQGLNSDEFVELYKKSLYKKNTGLKDQNYEVLKKLVAFSFQHNIGKIHCVWDEKKQLHAAVFFIRSHNKSITLAAVTSLEGRKSRAMFYLLDEYIKANSESNLILDFEGSNIEGVAQFYAGFGAQACEYYTIKQNNLPWPIRLFK